MKQKTRISGCALLLIPIALIAIQIGISVVWMSKNIAAFPLFGDSNEYLELSRTFALDEYRPILYPLILNGIQTLGQLTGIPFQLLTYVIQTVLNFTAIFYGVTIVERMLSERQEHSISRICLRLLISCYILTIPMMTFMNFSILTDSLATTLLIVLLTELILLSSEDRPSWIHIPITGLSLFAESLLRADRQYSCLLLLILFLLVRLLKKRSSRLYTLLAILFVCGLIPLATRTINHHTQTPGLNGRIQTNADFILLGRIVWPHMEENYDSFPDEIKSILTKKDARVFDEHNNNVMYQMAPLVEGAVGSDRAGEVYRTMAQVVWRNQPLRVIGDISEDILAMLFTPVSSFLNTLNLCEKGDSWNIHCMSTISPDLTARYNLYYQLLFLLLFVIGSVSYLRHPQSREALRAMRRIIRPYIAVSIIFTLWFCIGDGAPPNDRYALIIYVTWALIECSMIGLLHRSQNEF